MAKEWISNDGRIIQRDGFGRYKVNGQKVPTQAVRQIVKDNKGKIYDSSDKSARDFYEKVRPSYKF